MSKMVKRSDIKAGKTFYTAPMNIREDGTKVIGTIYETRYMSKVSTSQDNPRVKLWFRYHWAVRSFVKSTDYYVDLYTTTYTDLPCKTKEFKRYKDAVKAQQDFLKYYIVTKEELLDWKRWGSHDSDFSHDFPNV